MPAAISTVPSLTSAPVRRRSPPELSESVPWFWTVATEPAFFETPTVTAVGMQTSSFSSGSLSGLQLGASCHEPTAPPCQVIVQTGWEVGVVVNASSSAVASASKMPRERSRPGLRVTLVLANTDRIRSPIFDLLTRGNKPRDLPSPPCSVSQRRSDEAAWIEARQAIFDPAPKTRRGAQNPVKWAFFWSRLPTFDPNCEL